MASTRDIKRRVRGISSTMQITKAMEMVSSSKLRRAREIMEEARPYYNTVYLNIKDALASTGKMKHPYLEKREVKRSLYILVTADRGLAGGFNSNAIRTLERKIKDRKDEVSLILVGSKGRDYFAARGYDVLGEFVGITEDPDFSHARNIGDMALKAFKDGDVDEVEVIFTEFVSTLSQKAKTLRLLPSDEFEEDVEEANTSVTLTDFEPSPEEVLDYLIPKYIQSVIYGALIESSCSQQGARMTAMKSATDNAEEMIEELELLYNRARQAAITAELTEIVTGADALK